MKEKRLPIPQLIIIIGTMTSLIYLIIVSDLLKPAGKSNVTGSVVAIVVILIGVFGGMWGQIIHFKRVLSNIGDVKSDTEKIKYQVSNISEDTKQIRDDVIRKLVPEIKTIEQSADGIKQLVDELNYQNRLRSEIITHLQIENDSLRKENNDLQNLIKQRNLNFEDENNLEI